jgi:hypothetical protein
MVFKTVKEAEKYVGGLGKPSKMPGLSYGIPATRCKVGAELVKIPNSVCSDCYALKGRYTFANVIAAQERRFKSLHSPRWVEAMVFLIRYKKETFFRWHDAGDLQGEWHLENIAEVARRCPRTKFWLPTREKVTVARYMKDVVNFPSNLVIRVSGTMVDGPAPLRFVNTSTVTTDKAGVTCPAQNQGNECGTCRACWDVNVPNVAYPKH